MSPRWARSNCGRSRATKPTAGSWSSTCGRRGKNKEHLPPQSPPDRAFFSIFLRLGGSDQLGVRESMEQASPTQTPSHSRYLVGIDLGTTNCAVAYVDTARSATVQHFPIPQLVNEATLAPLPT